MLYSEDGEALENVAQRSCGHLNPGNVHLQVGLNPKYSGLVGGVPAHGRSI